MNVYDKSLKVLKKIVRNQEKFGFRICLVGGWAVWLYNPYMKSKDIDLIVKKDQFWKLKNFLTNFGFKETSKVLEKRGFSMLFEDEKIEIDVYDKRLGEFDVDELMKKSVEKKLGKHKLQVLSITDLFLVKSKTALNRVGTAKGEKDLSDLLALLETHEKIDLQKVNQRVNLSKLLRILLSDYKQTSRMYPMSHEKYKEVLNHLKKLKLF